MSTPNVTRLADDGTVTFLQSPIEQAATDLVKTVAVILETHGKTNSQSLFAHGAPMVTAAAKVIAAVAMLHLPPPATCVPVIPGVIPRVIQGDE